MIPLETIKQADNPCEHEWIVDPNWGRTGKVIHETCRFCGVQVFRAIDEEQKDG